MSAQPIEIWVLALVHISMVTVWIGIHFFEILVLHNSFGKVPRQARLEFYPPLFSRLRQIRSLASVSTLYSGVLLASDIELGSLSFMVTTPWGVLSTLYFVVTVAGNLASLKPGTIAHRLFRLLGTGALVAASVAVVAYLALPTNLQVLLGSNWGLAIIAGGLLAVLLSRLGVITGSIRGETSKVARRIIAPDTEDDHEALNRRLLTLERRMKLLFVPEDILIIIVLALMVYASKMF